MKIIVYTALFADDRIPIENVGNFIPYTHIKGDVEYIAFTNRTELKSDFWDIRYVELKYKSSRLTARYYKINSHKILPNHNYSIWLDSQCYFIHHPYTIIQNYLIKNEADISIHHHSDINNLVSEAIAQSWVYKNDNPKIIMNQIIKYAEDGFPLLGYDHYETGILLRNNNSNVMKFNEMWWCEIENNSIRDQISAPFVVWKCRNENIKIYTIMESFTAHKHKLSTPKSKTFFTIPKPILKEDISLRKL
jgi:hypothetical protein